MKILVLNYEFPPLGGGAGDVAKALCREYAARGHEVKVITSWYTGLPRHERIDGYEVHRVRACRRHRERSDFIQMGCYVLGAFPALMHMCRTWRPDVIHSHFLLPTTLLAFAAWGIFRIPYIITLHGGDVPSHLPEQTSSVFRLVKPVAGLIGSHATCIAAVSEGLCRLAGDDFPRLRTRIVHIGNGVHTEGPPRGEKFPVPTFLFVGRLSPEKNLPFLMEAMARIRSRYRFILAGDGPERKTVESLIVRHNLQDTVLLKGWVERPEIQELMRGSHFLVLPSAREGMPMVVLQAYACGLPVIATRIPGLETLVEHGRTGFLLDPGDSAGLAEILQEVCDNPALSANMSASCYETAVTRYPWEKSAQAYLSHMERRP